MSDEGSGDSRIADVGHYAAAIRRQIGAAWTTGSGGRRATILAGGAVTALLAAAFLFGAWHLLFGGFVKGNWRAGAFGLTLAGACGVLLAGEAALLRRRLAR